MKTAYTISVGVELDDWEVEALKDLYTKMGLMTDKETRHQAIMCIVNDVWDQALRDIREGFLDALAFTLRGPAPDPLSSNQLRWADELEAHWLCADLEARREFLRRLSAWQTNRGRFWTLTLNAPTRPEVTW